MMHEMTQSAIRMHDRGIDAARRSQWYDAACATSEMPSYVSLVASVDVYHSLRCAMHRYLLLTSRQSEGANDEAASTID